MVYGPKNLKNLIKEVAEQRKRDQERQQQEKEEQERQQKLEEERNKVREEIKLRKRKLAEKVPQKSDEELASYSVSAVKDGMAVDDSLPRTNKPSGGLWTDDDLVELVRLVKKYPGGTTNRWETIAEMMNRSVYDVTHMAAKLKETAYKVPGQVDSPAEQIALEATKNKVKTRKVTQENAQAESVWTQEQQKALEAAIIKHPKSAVGDRWQKIASSVPGKTKEECLARYKYLVELIKKQKQTTDPQEGKPEQEQDATEPDCVNTEETPEKEETESLSKKSEKKSKKKQKQRKGSDDDEEQEEVEEVATTKTAGGKAKNKRKARKKDFEISYDDYQDSDDDDDYEN